ncbi:YciC family protein [Neptunomonas phycophila]|uniref:YciC family protein n=1 Tax=Neptunomonas phycophila TaxID=1572645 RepID=UPI0026E2D009|nr:YciC family protein [Neptunomonas phycophila]MDO6469097.1 YciC family protein [Neptunomonas phycophila]MDO6785119.1 YciC family protein [Neptunomonas phycophila]
MLSLTYIQQSIFFFRQHLGTIAKIQLPFLIAINGLAQWFDIYSDDEQIAQQFAVLSILNLTILPLYWSATIVYMQSVLEDRPLSAFQSLVVGMSRWRTLLLTFLLTGCAVFGGLMFLIVPGIFIGVRLAFADYICVVEKKSALQSLKQSWQDTDDYFWPLLQGLAILYIAIELINYPVVSFFQSMEDRQFIVELPILAALDLLSALITVFAFRMYCVMRDEIRPAKPIARSSAQADNYSEHNNTTPNSKSTDKPDNSIDSDSSDGGGDD